MITSWTCDDSIAADAAPAFRSHPPMRPLPVASQRPLAAGAAKFVDAAQGDDANDGSQAKPWRTINRSVKRLSPGDTLYLRGGTYYEGAVIAALGTAEQPITLRSYPGELAIIDGGIPEFFETPATAWEPVPGSDGEFRSTRTYLQAGGSGNLGDSMAPLHRYLYLSDLRSTNELDTGSLGKRQYDPVGIYCGPGVMRNPETGRIHVRLAHTQLAGLGSSAYRGETDPRRLPLVVSGRDYALRIDGAKHFRLQDVVVRGGERSAILVTRDQEDIAQDATDIELDGVTLYGTGSALRVEHAQRVRVVNSALRGHSAPWHSRFHHKYRANAGYLFVAEGRDIELANSEITDHHDGLQLYGAVNMHVHHCWFDNFNDDGIEPGPKKAQGRNYFYQNYLSRALNPFTLHGGTTPVYVDGEPGSGIYIYRNVVDLRQGTYKSPPKQPDPTGAFLNEPTTLIDHDHGSPIHPNYYVYHNDFLMPGKSYRDMYALSWGGHTRGTTRRVFNNICIQASGMPGLTLVEGIDRDDFQADGNLHWSLSDGERFTGDFFAKYRASKFFLASQEKFPGGWGAHDVFGDPRFVSLVAQGNQPADLRIKAGSPAVDAGVGVPTEWPDPLRTADQGKPDIGALPLGAEPLRVGVAGYSTSAAK